MSKLFGIDDENFSMSPKGFSVITDLEAPSDETVNGDDLKHEIPILPLRNMVIFPHVFMPVLIGRTSSLRLIKEAEKKKLLVGVMTQINASNDEPGLNDLYPLGVIARVVRIIDLPDGNTTAIVHAMDRVQLNSIETNYPYLKGYVSLKREMDDADGGLEDDAMMKALKETMEHYVRELEASQDLIFALRNIPAGIAVNYICSNINIKAGEKQKLLGADTLNSRFMMLMKLLNREIQFSELMHSIQNRTRVDIDQQQKQYFLQQQIKTIQNELGVGQGSDVVNKLRQRARGKNWDEKVRDLFMEELEKLEQMNPQVADYGIQLNYLNTILDLPWGVYTKDNHNLTNAKRILDKDHYGLDEVKERILEHLAVLKLKNDMKSPILCLYGPPGVGKTSLGRSIAAALKREYVRISLGGVHDEAEIRGHRRTYIGAMPGRIVKGLIKAKSSNPVFILDEIDKLGSSHNGDPSAALLEVLDPEQNKAFHDNFLDLDYDLSKVMFIATANDLSAIPAPLRDRMELIEVSGYVTEEKVEIARKHLMPKLLETNGLNKRQVKMSKDVIETIVEDYTRESGVRELEKKLSKVLRKVAVKLATYPELMTVEVQSENLKDFLGVKRFSRDKYQGNDYAGVVTGLAWTAVGGEILFVETSLSRGKAARLTLTGNLGDVMKESAMLALEYIKAHADLLQIDEEIFNNWNIHIHVPEGAIPKDGPSAGITMATSLASALTQRKVKAGLAMTGEITLRGKVLPVGGIKEKILAAKRAGINEIILCQENQKDIEEINALYLKGMTFHYVTDIKEVFELALLKEKVAHPLDLTVKKEKEEVKSTEEAKA